MNACVNGDSRGIGTSNAVRMLEGGAVVASSIGGAMHGIAEATALPA